MARQIRNTRDRNGAPGGSKGWIVPSVLCGCLALLVGFEWRGRNAAHEELKLGLLGAVSRLGKRFEVKSGQLDVHLRAIKEAIDGLPATVAPGGEPLGGNGGETDGTKAGGVVDIDGDSVGKEEKGLDELMAEFPPLPEDVGDKALSTLATMNLEEFLEANNPDGKVLSRLARQKADNVWTQGRAWVELLESEVRLGIVEGMEELTKGGEFVSYEEDQAPVEVPGVITAGEPRAGGGMNVFYFYPEDFPELYAKKGEKVKVAEYTLRRLLALTQSQS